VTATGQQQDGPWKIIAEPQGRNVNNPGEKRNDGGLVIFLYRPYSGGMVGQSEAKQEVNRVAFDRTQSTNPDKSFSEVCDEVIAAAVHACKILNNDLMGDGKTLA
jgi:hypothetical protein